VVPVTSVLKVGVLGERATGCSHFLCKNEMGFKNVASRLNLCLTCQQLHLNKEVLR